VNIEVQELLADELHRRADAVTWRPALLDNVLKRHRERALRRRATTSAAVMGVAIAVLAVSVSAIASSHPIRPARPTVQTVAYVVGRTRSAVSAVGADILEVHSRLSNGWSYSAWLEPAAGDSRVDMLPPAGAGGALFYYSDRLRAVLVNYQTKTYSTASLIGPGLGVARDLMQLSVFPVSVSWGNFGPGLPTPAVIRQELASRSFRLVGTETVNGQRLLHLRGASTLPPLGPRGWGYDTLDIWISSATYLPVSSVTGLGPYAPRVYSTFKWLRPTRQNRAVFAPEIPSGFRNESALPHRLVAQPAATATANS
jgi:hypothetical protein